MRFSNWMGALLVPAAIMVMQGCASLPSAEVMKTETARFNLPKLPEPGMAIVYVVRPSHLGGMVRFNVFLDDKQAPSEMGFNRGSQYI
jgi:hypothetical protein